MALPALPFALFFRYGTIYMGAKDVEDKRKMSDRMKLLGAEVIPVTAGSQSLKDAINETIRDWTTNANNLIICGTVAGPHLINDGSRFSRNYWPRSQEQFFKINKNCPMRWLPALAAAQIQLVYFDFIDNLEVKIYGVEAAGKDLETKEHASSIAKGERLPFCTAINLFSTK